MKTVAIVGAGLADFIAAKVLLEDGFDVAVFDTNATLGDVSSFKGSYYDLHTHQTGGTMEFSDLYDGEDKFTLLFRWKHVYEYLCKYVDKIGLRSYIRLRSLVLSISKASLHDGEESWSIKVEQTTEMSS